MMVYSYEDLIAIENIFQAWSEFVKGKRKKKDVQEFAFRLEDNLFDLHRRLKTQTYRHGGYEDFYVSDPKKRHIHKAEVEDRIVHHLLYKYLYKIFDKIFIFDSYSCRVDKGTHRAVRRLQKFTRKISENYTKPCWALKLDIKKFFLSIDHKILLRLLEEKIDDKNTLKLLGHVITSYNEEEEKGIPLGNLTSQIFANLYLNELDQFVKHKLKVKYYIRYADDFILFDSNRKKLSKFFPEVKEFLKINLKLELHRKKIIVRELDWGIDFLGYIVLAHYILVRTKTKRRIFKKLKDKFQDYSNGVISYYSFNQSFQSYLGFLKHANAYEIIKKLKNKFI